MFFYRKPNASRRTGTLTNLFSGVALSVGGPMFTMWITPSEEEIRSRYNPELLKKSNETREERQQEFDDFVTRLKDYSKSDKPSMFLMMYWFSRYCCGY